MIKISYNFKYRHINMGGGGGSVVLPISSISPTLLISDDDLFSKIVLLGQKRSFPLFA